MHIKPFQKIGLLDSGVGGLSVLQELVNRFSGHYIYLADTKHLPYGNKTIPELIAITQKNVAFLIKKDVDVIIFACHTLSGHVLEYMRKKYPAVMFVGMIDVVLLRMKQLAGISSVGIMATPLSIKSHYHQQALKKIDVSLKIIEQSCPDLALFIEQYDSSTKLIRDNLRAYTKIFIDHQVDAIILGCTHYEFVRKQIASQLNNILIISVAEEISTLFHHSSYDASQRAHISFFVTGDVDHFKNRCNRLFSFKTTSSWFTQAMLPLINFSHALL